MVPFGCADQGAARGSASALCILINHLSPASAEKNERILAGVEARGGGFVWDAEVFAVTLMDVAITDAEAKALAGLVGVQQIAMDCSKTSLATLCEIAAIPGLQSLMLCNPTLGEDEMKLLSSVGAEVDVVEK